MTTSANLHKGTAPNTGVAFAGDIFSFDISDMNAVITAYNSANGTSFPLFDNPTDDFEKFCHFLDIYKYVQGLALGNNTFNVRIVAVTPVSQTYGTRGSLNSRQFNFAYPFSSNSDVLGDPNNVG
jgi:hypothetical protein